MARVACDHVQPILDIFEYDQDVLRFIPMPTRPLMLVKGKYAGFSVEQVMIIDYEHILKIRYNLKREKSCSKLAKHIEWLLSRGEDRVSQRLCIACKNRCAEYVIIIGDDKQGYRIPFDGYCRDCVDDYCDEWNRNLAKVPLRFSSIEYFRVRSDRTRFVSVLRKHFGLTKTMSAEEAYTFFSS